MHTSTHFAEMLQLIGIGVFLGGLLGLYVGELRFSRHLRRVVKQEALAREQRNRRARERRREKKAQANA